MSMNHLLRLFPIAALSVALIWGVARAEEPAPPEGAKVESGEVAVPAPEAQPEQATASTEASPEAQAALDQVRDAYKALTSLELSGKLSADFDIDGQTMNKDAGFTASFAAPNKFRHETTDDILLGSTGEKIYAYNAADQSYLIADAPAERTVASDIPSPMGQILDQQNPSLLLALVPDAGGQLVEGVTKVEKIEDVKIDDASYSALRLTTADEADVTLLIDPATHLVRRMSVDLKKTVAARGEQNVNKALYTIDYTTVTPNEPVKDEAFAWAPPEGARDVAALAAAREEEGGGRAANDLEGEAAPDFTLSTPDGDEVKLSDLKGKVVVIDFWATWCGPCRVGLPHLDKLTEQMKDKGVKVFAVNLKEDEAKVEDFIEETKLSTPVLLDTEGETAAAYGVTGIPQTVVIGKDGKVAKVFVGFDPSESPKLLEDAVNAAMK